jgi:hypothetical protein
MKVQNGLDVLFGVFLRLKIEVLALSLNMESGLLNKK